MNGDTTPVLPMSGESLSKLSALLVRLKAQGLDNERSMAILQRWAASKKAMKAADDRALRAAQRCGLVKRDVLSADPIAKDLARELRARERDEVVYPRPVEIRAPRKPAEVTVPAPTRPRPWWRLW
jgi:hypothetical protein